MKYKKENDKNKIKGKKKGKKKYEINEMKNRNSDVQMGVNSKVSSVRMVLDVGSVRIR